jgi:ribosome-binding factor A
MKKYRPERIAELLKEEVSEIVSYEMNDPRLGLVTITRVTVSPDLRHAKMYVTHLGPSDDREHIIGVLNRAAGYIRRQLFPRLHLRVIPQLTFVYDDAIARAARLEDVFQEIRREAHDSESGLPASEER